MEQEGESRAGSFQVVHKGRHDEDKTEAKEREAEVD